MNCTYVKVNVFQLYQKCYEYLVVHYIFTVFISIGSQHILHLLLNNSPSLRWTIYTNFLHLKWLYDKIIMKMSETLSHLSISGVKSRVLKLSFLILKMMVKSGLEFIFEIHRAPSEIPAKLPCQFGHSGQIFFALGSSNSEGARSISK